MTSRLCSTRRRRASFQELCFAGCLGLRRTKLKPRNCSRLTLGLATKVTKLRQSASWLVRKECLVEVGIAWLPNRPRDSRETANPRVSRQCRGYDRRRGRIQWWIRSGVDARPYGCTAAPFLLPPLPQFRSRGPELNLRCQPATRWSVSWSSVQLQRHKSRSIQSRPECDIDLAYFRTVGFSCTH